MYIHNIYIYNMTKIIISYPKILKNIIKFDIYGLIGNKKNNNSPIIIFYLIVLYTPFGIFNF